MFASGLESVASLHSLLMCRFIPKLCDDSLALRGEVLRCRVSLSQVLNVLRHEMR